MGNSGISKPWLEPTGNTMTDMIAQNPYVRVKRQQTKTETGWWRASSRWCCSPWAHFPSCRCSHVEPPSACQAGDGRCAGDTVAARRSRQTRHRGRPRSRGANWFATCSTSTDFTSPPTATPPASSAGASSGAPSISATPRTRCFCSAAASTRRQASSSPSTRRRSTTSCAVHGGPTMIVARAHDARMRCISTRWQSQTPCRRPSKRACSWPNPHSSVWASRWASSLPHPRAARAGAQRTAGCRRRHRIDDGATAAPGARRASSREGHQLEPAAPHRRRRRGCGDADRQPEARHPTHAGSDPAYRGAARSGRRPFLQAVVARADPRAGGLEPNPFSTPRTSRYRRRDCLAACRADGPRSSRWATSPSPTFIFCTASFSTAGSLPCAAAALQESRRRSSATTMPSGRFSCPGSPTPAPS